MPELIILSPLFNRAGDTLPTDGFYHLIPKGEFPILIEGDNGKQERIIQVIDDKAIDAMVNCFANESRKPNFAGLLVDQEHYSYDVEKSSEAFGWIKELQNRADGAWGKIEWTNDLGLPAVKNGRYKFVSPVWLPIPGHIEKLGNNRVRPLRLDTAGLTNNPNLKGMVPLSNRWGVSAPSADDKNKNKSTQMKSVAAKLNLSAEASEEAVLSAVTAIMNRAEKAEADLAPMKNRAEKAETKVTELEGSLVDVTLDKYANRFAKDKRDGWKKAILANRETTVELLEGLPVIGGKVTPLLNRRSAGTPETTETEGEVTHEKLNSAVQAIMNRDGSKFPEAWATLMSEQPALFAK